MGRARGWEGDPEGLLGKVMGEVRRSMSVTVVRAQAVCLLERLAHLLPGARAAAQRRQVARGGTGSVRHSPLLMSVAVLVKLGGHLCHKLICNSLLD